MNNSLALIQPDEYRMIESIARTLMTTGFLPDAFKKPEQAIAVILAGRELGIQPWQSLSTISVIKNKVTISPQLMLALIHRSGQLEDMQIDGDDRQCTVTMKRRGQSAHSEVFTFESASKMGVTGNPTWKSIPSTMLKWRAVGACARMVFPDIILGLYTPDELGAEVTVSDDGDMQVLEVAVETGDGGLASGTRALLGNGRQSNSDDRRERRIPTDGDLTDRTNAEKFVLYWRDQGLSDADVLAALGVDRLGKWTHGRKAADAAVESYINAGLEGDAANHKTVTEPEDEPEVVPVIHWTPNVLYERVHDLFKARPHYDAALGHYTDAFHDEFLFHANESLDEAEAAVRYHRSVTGAAELAIFSDLAVRDKFVGACIDLAKNDDEIKAALNNVTDYNVPAIGAWKGDKATAWAAVHAYASRYDYGSVPGLYKLTDMQRAIVRRICDRWQSMNSAQNKDANKAQKQTQEPAKEQMKERSKERITELAQI